MLSMVEKTLSFSADFKKLMELFNGLSLYIQPGGGVLDSGGGGVPV